MQAYEYLLKINNKLLVIKKKYYLKISLYLPSHVKKSTQVLRKFAIILKEFL